MSDNTMNTDYDYMDFDETGREWGEMSVEGPAVLAPEHIRSLVVIEYGLEWLNISTTWNQCLKNHLVATVVLQNPVYLDGQTYFAAQLSMELAGDDQDDKDIWGAEHLTPLQHYWIGTYHLALRNFEGTHKRCIHNLTFKLKQGTTIGHIIDRVVEKRMHHFCFYPYTKGVETQVHWRGCRDHVLNCWAVLFGEGIITSKDSKEHPGTPLWKELNLTYHQEEDGGTFKPSPMLIEHGWWVFRKPTQDDHTPDQAFSKRKPDIPLDLLL